MLLAALLTLRRVAIYHPQLLGDSLEDVSQVSRVDKSVRMGTRLLQALPSEL